jgi:hypothetical protein
VGSSGWIGTPAHEQQADQPAASRLIGTVLGVPCRGRDRRSAPRPIVARASKPLSSVAPLPNCGQVKLVERLAPWKRGSG